MIIDLVKKYYGIIVETVEKSPMGVGADTYFITSGDEKFVLKFPFENAMNHPQNEPELCAYLSKKGLPVSEFLRNYSGNFISADPEGRIFHLQKFVNGQVYGVNQAPQWLLIQSAQVLGKIHTALFDYKGLPEGIGKGFFNYRTRAIALDAYKLTLDHNQQEGEEIKNDLLYRIDLMSRFPDYQIDLSRLTCQNTHGDYLISQLICEDQTINAVIDWTTACVHPLVWEIMRSYVFGSPNCSHAEIDIDEFINYVGAYLEYAPLNQTDIKMMPYVFYYQIAVSNYYQQYFQADEEHKMNFYHQTKFSTDLMRWFEKHIDEVSEALLSCFGK